MTNDILKDTEIELESLKKDKAERLQPEIDALKKEQADFNRVKAEMTTKKEKDALKAEIKAELIAEQNKNTHVGIDVTGDNLKKPKSDLGIYRNKYLKNHGYKHVEYGSNEWVSGTYNFTESDSGCSNDVSDWTPDEVFADTIWSAFYCKGYLAGKVTVRGVDFARGKGDTVSIRMRGKRTAQGPLSACECLSCVSSSFTKVSLTLDSYGDLAEICELDLQHAGDIVKDGILEDMASGLAEQVDLEIYSQLVTANAGFTDTLNSCCTSGPSLDSCCFDVFDLYDSIVTMEANMRENGVTPNYIILAPSVAAHFKYKQALSQEGLQISYNGNELSKIGSMSVIEFPCAKRCDGTGGVIAVILDSNRAVGEGWGKRPTMEQDRDIDCDSTTVAIHMYVGIDELDVNAIGLISVPTC
jgi:hypothetical protein